MSAFKIGEVWFAEFPYEEDPSTTSNRPVVVIDEDKLGVLSVKITKHKIRNNEKYDMPIIYWQDAGLRLASTARISKTTRLDPSAFIFRIGELHPDDLAKILAAYAKFVLESE